MFKNRTEAGNLLADQLSGYSKKNAVIVAIPRGGVPIGYAISKKLSLPLEIVLSKKIGHPFNKEFAIGAVTLSSKVLSTEANEVSNIYIEDEIDRIRDILKQRQQLYYGNRKPLDLGKKIVIVVDDGIATGNTLISSVKLIQLQKPSQIIITLPVAPTGALQAIKQTLSIDTVICLIKAQNFYAVGQFYKNFNQVSDIEVIDLLNLANSSLL